MPLSALLAIFVAFWFEPPAGDGPLSGPEMVARAWRSAGLLGLVAGAAFSLGWGVARQVARRGGAPGPRARRLLAWGTRGLNVLALAAFAWIVHGLGWPRVVKGVLGAGDPVLIDDALILAPYLLAQLAVWWGLYGAEEAVRPGRSHGLSRYLTLNARQSLGLVLPVALAFATGQDVLRRSWPGSSRLPWAQLAAIAALGASVMVLAPALVRLSWPTRPLPPGPLRDRLERLARRCRFRYTDILVWDTGGAVVNAGVTGATRHFRYVLLSDALIEYLPDREIEAVFGHEIGHIAHRHLAYFGLFFLGSLGVMALVSDAILAHLKAGSPMLAGLSDPNSVEAARGGAALLIGGLYFLVVFGFLSRRLERQSDVFGSRAVSCGRDACPPHLDLDGDLESAVGLRKLCPVGIRTFANALATVAALNGIEPSSRSWRHGSIRGRIRFLEGLEGHPESECRFQAGVSRLRVALAILLVSALALAWYTGALSQLR